VADVVEVLVEVSPVGLVGNDEDEVAGACGACGWRGPWRESIRQALDEVDAHEGEGCGGG
jgi:hypothetical protein